MKKHILLLIALLSSSWAFAQTQQGYVKTLGRPDKAGEPLNGVSVRVKGSHNEVLSGSDGTFEMRMDGKKNGEAYALQSVQKVGFELNEYDVIGRQFAFSDKVRLEIVMVSSSVLQAEKRRIEDNAYRTAERNYKAKASQIEQQLQDSTISIQQYRERTAELQDKFEKYQSLIDGLAEHYAHTDYDMLDDKDREINICIENGELERADSLINTLFDPIGVLERNMEALARIEQQISQAQGIIDQANEDMAAVLKQQEKDAEYLYQLYTIALARYDNEKAQFYIETRAALDTTNVEWQNQAGLFADRYFSDFNKAYSYYQLALRQALTQYGEKSEKAAMIYSNLGTLFDGQRDFNKAIEYQNKALTIRKTVLGKTHQDVAQSFNNLASAYSSLGKYKKALEYYNKALDIWKAVYGDESPFVAICYNGIGSAHLELSHPEKAMEYYCEALNIQTNSLGETHQDVALSYNNIGYTHTELGNYELAIEYYNKALKIYKTIFGEHHPYVATSYSNIAYTQMQLGNSDQALEYYDKALTIYKTIFGEYNHDVAACYTFMGVLHFMKGNDDLSIEYLNNALPVLQSILGENHPDVISIIQTIEYIRTQPH